MQTSTEPVPLQRSDLDRAADVLARAFHDDPGIVWILPNEGPAAPIIRQVYRALGWGARCEHASETGCVDLEAPAALRA